MIKYLAAISAVSGLLLWSGPAAAQRTLSIAAIVNDDVVSVFDLDARLQMVIVSSGLRTTRKLREKLAPQVLRGLIDERIRLQEAKRRNVSVTESNLQRAITVIEKRNKVAPGQLKSFLADNRIPVSTLLSQLRAQIAWGKLVNRRLRPRVTISQEEIEEVLQRIKLRVGQTEYRIAEIFLTLDSPEQEAEVRRGAERLVEQLRNGARFEPVARQFSQSNSAASGGDLGWFHESDLDDDLKPVITNLKPGAVSGPIYSLSGIRIVKLIGIRRIASDKPMNLTMKLGQIFLPLPPKAGDKEVATQLRRARTLAGTVAGCPDMARVAKEVKSPLPANLGKVKLSDLSPLIRTAVSNLAVNTASAPLRTGRGVLVLMVCERDQPKPRLPSREDIESRLIAKRLSLMARRYMRDLRYASVVDMRL